MHTKTNSEPKTSEGAAAAQPPERRRPMISLLQLRREPFSIQIDLGLVLPPSRPQHTTPHSAAHQRAKITTA
jgi:hypothetical protein